MSTGGSLDPSGCPSDGSILDSVQDECFERGGVADFKKLAEYKKEILEMGWGSSPSSSCP